MDVHTPQGVRPATTAEENKNSHASARKAYGQAESDKARLDAIAAFLGLV